MTRKSPKRSNARNARVLRTALRRKWRSAMAIDLVRFLSLFLVQSIVNFLVSSDADQFAVRPHLFCDPFLAQASYATVCESKAFSINIYLEKKVILEKEIILEKNYFNNKLIRFVRKLIKFVCVWKKFLFL